MCVLVLSTRILAGAVEPHLWMHVLWLHGCRRWHGPQRYLGKDQEQPVDVGEFGTIGLVSISLLVLLRPSPLTLAERDPPSHSSDWEADDSRGHRKKTQTFSRAFTWLDGILTPGGLESRPSSHRIQQAERHADTSGPGERDQSFAG